MLVLSRKVGERLVINDNITITICKCGRNRVTVGIDAPQAVGILRGEIPTSERTSQSDQSTSSCKKKDRQKVGMSSQVSSC